MRDLLSIGTSRGCEMIGTGLGLGLAGYRWRTSSDIMPSLDLQFADRKMISAVLGPTPSFSRASTGTYFDASGVLQSAAVNGARFNHSYNGTNWVSRGLLVEEQRTNLVQYSEQFNTSPWAVLNASISANAASSPDGNTTADKLVESATGPHGHEVYVTFTALTATYTFSIFAKAAERSSIYLSLGSSITSGVYFNLSNGTIGTASGGLTGSIQNVGNGWYRCSVVGSLSSGTNYIQIAISNGTSYDYTGNGTSGLLLFGAQLELGSFPTSYIPTTSASATRSADVCQITGSDFSSFWNASEGSFAVDYDSASPQGWTGAYPVLTFSDSSTNAKRIWYSGEGGLGGNRFYVNDPSGSTTLIATPISGGSIPTKASAAYKQNDLAFSYNGGTPYTGASQLIPSGIDILRIGQNPASGNQFCGHIARIRYYPVRIPNATLQTLST